jgi:hypothetical protein
VEESDETNNGFAAGNATSITKNEGPSFVLTVVRPTTGVVTSNPDGIRCGGKNKACKASFRTVTLTATPNTGYGFKSWTGCASATAVCELTLSKATKVQVKFRKLPK